MCQATWPESRYTNSYSLCKLMGIRYRWGSHSGDVAYLDRVCVLYMYLSRVVRRDGWREYGQVAGRNTCTYSVYGVHVPLSRTLAVKLKQGHPPRNGIHLRISCARCEVHGGAELGRTAVARNTRVGTLKAPCLGPNNQQCFSHVSRNRSPHRHGDRTVPGGVVRFWSGYGYPARVTGPDKLVPRYYVFQFDLDPP